MTINLFGGKNLKKPGAYDKNACYLIQESFFFKCKNYIHKYMKIKKM